MRSGAKVCKSCRSGQELSNEYLLAKIGFDTDTAENGPLKVRQQLVKVRKNVRTNIIRCICMWAFASLINTVGCSNVQFDCDATDLAYVCDALNDNNVNLQSAHDCIKSQCTGHTLGGQCT